MIEDNQIMRERFSNPQIGEKEHNLKNHIIFVIWKSKVIILVDVANPMEAENSEDWEELDIWCS